ncbi:MAG: hypothetical protein AAF927_18510 [Bacteroidota bacterium]
MVRLIFCWSLSLLVLAGLNSCYTDSSLCPDCESDQGIIVSFEAGPTSDCETVRFSQDQNLILTEDSAYQALYLSNNAYTACDSLAFESVDFSQHSVLSMAVTGSGCSRSFCVGVLDDVAEKQYRFIARVIECGGCEPLEIVRFWVVVPKLPADYSVSFETIREQY